MPRARPAPETNIVQRPEIVRALQQVTGVRQAHVAPTITGTIQPVVIVADATTAPQTHPVRYIAQSQTSGVVSGHAHYLVNPFGSGRLVRPHRMWVSPMWNDVLNFALDLVTTPIPNLQSVKPGKLMSVGNTGLDQQRFPTSSAIRLQGADVLVLASTHWEQFMPSAAGVEGHFPFYIEFPYMVIGPGPSANTGGALIVWPDTGPVQLDVAIEWTEEPLP